MRFRRGPNTEELQENWQPRLYLGLFVLALLIAYVIAIVLENRTTVPVHFVFVTTRVSLIWIILLSVAIGVLGGILAAQLERRRRRRRAGQ